MSNFEELMKTAKQNTSGDKSVSRLDKGLAVPGKSAPVGGRGLVNGGKLKEPPPPPPRSSSPIGRSLLERNHSRLKNKRSYDTMMKGIDPRGSPSTAPPTSSTGSGTSKSKSAPTKSSDLVRRPLRDPATNTPHRQNGMKSNGSQSGGKPSSERLDKISRQGEGPLSSRGGTSKGQITSQGPSSANKGGGGRGGGLRGSKGALPPLSSLTPQQIQKLREARRAAAASKMPPSKKKAVNPNAFYGSAASRILQRKGDPKLSASGPVKYTSSYVDEMMDYLQSEGMNGVDDLYSDEEDDFIASDDEFIDDSEDYGDYSSAIKKIFGYDRSR